MNAKRIFRGPILWIVLAVIAIGLLVDLTGNLTGGYSEEPTSKVVSIINGNDPIKEVILVDGEQEIQVTMAGDNPAKYKAV
ncbi:MAG TPA: cell division protein FtsH, partial [Microlunatus sp.]|nr:cell division protein FtsH [Microlunatus sp.]